MRERFLAFVAEQFPFALDLAAAAFAEAVKAAPASEKEIDALRAPIADALRSAGLRESSLFLDATASMRDVETTPGVRVGDRLTRAVEALVDACDGGPCYWGALYDPETGRFSELAFNGSG